MPINEFKEQHPISWALATVAEHAELLIHLDDEQRRNVYTSLGLEPGVIDLIEHPTDDNRARLQELIDGEWPEDPDVIYTAVVRGVVR